MHRHSRFRCSTGSSLSETERGCVIGINQFLFHLVAGPEVKLLRGLIVFVNDTAICSGELNRPANDGAQHSLQIKGGADCLSDLAKRFHFLDRFRQLTCAFLQLLEQADVLDGDDRLVGKGF